MAKNSGPKEETPTEKKPKRVPKNKVRLENTTVRLTPEHKALIEATGRSPSSVIRDSLDQYFMIGEKPVKQADLGRIVKKEIEKGLAEFQKKQALIRQQPTQQGLGMEIS